MPVIRLTAFFKDDDGHGWEESHDKDGGVAVTSLTPYLQAFDSLMQTFRRPMLGGDAFYLGCRASYKTADNANAGDNLLKDPPLRGSQTYQQVAVNMGAPETAIKMRFRNEASTARSDAYTRGGWRQTVVAGVLDFVTSAQGEEWKRRADLYAAELIAKNYGWVGINPALTSRGKVTGYTQDAEGTVTLNVTATNGVALPASESKLTMKFARINESKSILNRALVVKMNSPNATCTTIKQVRVSPFETDGTYIAPVKGFIPYAAMSYYRLGRRKTGRPFDVGPGRSSVLVLH